MLWEPAAVPEPQGRAGAWCILGVVPGTAPPSRGKGKRGLAPATLGPYLAALPRAPGRGLLTCFCLQIAKAPLT